MDKYNEGVTMISLIISVIILIIITGVVLNELDDQGVVKQTKTETLWQQDMINEEQNKMDQVRNEQLRDWGF